LDSRPFTDFSFDAFLTEHKLMGSRCTACHALFVPPRSLCPKCYAANMEWEKMKGTGKIVAFTSIAFPTPAMAERGYDRENPYCTGVIELEEKVKVVAQIDGVDTRDPHSIPVGMPLQIAFPPPVGGAVSGPNLVFKPL